MTDDRSARPPIWQLVKEVMEHASGEMGYPAIKQRLWERYPDLNSATITCQIIICTVNAPSRIHYPENKKPRICASKYDFLYSTGRGKVVWYDAEKHGQWAIVHGADGALSVCLSQEPTADTDSVATAVAIADIEEANSAFALEAHLRDYLAKNLPTLPGQETPLTLYVEDGGRGRDGVEFQTDVGPIDLLAVSNGDFYVLELKLGRGPDAALGQILRYMGWVNEHLANGRQVYGVIVASEISKKLKYAATQVPNVRLMEYRLAVSLHPVTLKG
jgi:hypothetical protein